MEDQTQGRKLYVGNISYDSTNETLAQHFAQVGTVEDAIIIMDKMTNRSKGFGFVTMSAPEEANAAIEQLDGQELDGRPLKISMARPPRPREDRGAY